MIKIYIQTVRYASMASGNTSQLEDIYKICFTN